MAGPAIAQPPQQPVPTLKPVVVEGTRIPDERRETDQEAREELQRVPGAVDLVDETRIRESRAANLKDVLDFTPGILIRPRFGSDESQISIRGSGLRNNFHLRGINILIDGFPYGNADGFSDFEALELLTTKRIEVYRGASALASGATRSAARSTWSPRPATTPGSSRSAPRRARSASSRTTSAPGRCTVPGTSTSD